MYQDNTLSGKHILVTGGGSGIGFAITKRFLELGATVSICGRTDKKLERAKESLGELSSGLSTFQCDVREHEAVGEMIEKISKDHSGFCGLVNNAAGNFYCASEDLSPNGFRTVVDIVLHGTFNCTQHFGKRLIDEKKPGNILNIVTTYTETGSAFVLPSACSKAGVYALTTSLALEWATYGIRVNCVAPGPFPTEGAWGRLIPDENVEEMYKSILPTKRFGDKEELANLAVFLMSDLAPYITGECVAIDGAERLRGSGFNFLNDLMPREQLKGIFQAMRPAK